MSRRHYLADDIDPRRLILEKNVRHDPEADEALVDSIRRRGVLQPIVVTEREEEEFVVLAGHRRTLAAIEVGLDTVPVTVVNVGDDADRIIDQLAENDHRVALTAQDHVEAVAQLALFGMSAAQIAEETVQSDDLVEQALKVSRSEAARTIPADYGATLPELAAIAEFEDDEESLIKLTEALVHGGFNHAVRWAMDKRERTLVVSERVAELEAEGSNPIAMTMGVWGDRDADVQPVTMLRDCPEECPGRRIGVVATSGWDQGERTLSTRDEPVCVDWKSLGHSHHYDPAPSFSEAETAERAQREEEARRALQERKEATRRAEEVRREWIKEFVNGKLPADAVTKCVGFLMNGHYPAFSEEGAEELVGVASPKTKAQAERLLVAGVLAARSSEIGWGFSQSTQVSYLRMLTDWGYELAKIEQSIIDDFEQNEAGDE